MLQSQFVVLRRASPFLPNSSLDSSRALPCLKPRSLESEMFSNILGVMAPLGWLVMRLDHLDLTVKINSKGVEGFAFELTVR